MLKDRTGNVAAVVAELEKLTERKRAEQTLKTSEEWFRALIENASDAVAILDDKGMILYESPSAERILGQKPEQLEGTNFPDLIHPDDMQQAISHFQSVVENHGRTIDCQLRLKHKDGSWRTVEGTAQNLLYDPKIGGIVVNYRDITDRKKAEEELQSAELRFKTLFESSRDAIMLLAPERGFFKGNPATVEVFGCKDEAEFTTKTPAQLSPEYQPDGTLSTTKAQEMIAAAMEKGSRFFEWTHKRVDGREFLADVLLTRMEWGGKTVLQAIVRDIAERKKAEEAISASEKRYRLLVENASEGILVMQDGFVKFANRKTLEIFGNLGHTEQQVTSKPFTDFIHPEDRENFLGNSARCLAGEELDHACLFRAIGKGSEIRWLQLNGVHLDWEGKPGGLVFLIDVTERKRAEEALKTNEERFRALIENASDAIAILDEKGTILYESPSAERILGQKPEQLEGTNFPDLIHPDDMQQAISLFQSVVENHGRTIDCQLRIKHKDGSWRTVEVKAHNLLHDPKIGGIVVNYRDITPRKKVEEVLKESEERLKILFDASPDALYLNDLQGRILEGNKAADKLLGYSMEDYLGKSFMELGLISQEQIVRAVTLLARRQTQDPTQKFDDVEEFDLVRKDGSKVTAEIRTMPVSIKGQGMLLGIARDITERKKAEEAIRESESRYRLLAENLLDVIWTMDANLRYTYISPSVTSLRGYSVEEAMALSMEETTTPASLETALRVMAEAEAKEGVGSNGQPSSVTMELELTCKDGSTVWVENRITYLRDAEGRLTGYLGVSRDISDRRKAAEALRASEERFRTLIENASDAIAILDDKGTILYESPSAERILEQSPEQLEGMSFPDLIYPDDMQQAVSLFESVIENPGKIIDCRLRLKHKNGSWRTVEAKAQNLLRDPRIGGIVINYRDITERERAENQIMGRVKELRAFYSLAALTEREGITLEKLYQELADILPNSWQYTEIACARIVMGDSEFRTKNFTESAWRQSAPIKVNGSAAGKIEVGYLEERPELDEGPFMKEERLLIDAIAERIGHITGRKKAEETLRESEERLKILFDYAPDLYCLSTPEGIVVDANRFALELFGYQREEIVGKTFMESGVVSLEQFEGGTASTTQKPGDALQMVLNRKDGTKVTVEIRTIPVTIKGQSLMLSIARDITERKKAEEELRASDTRFKTLFESSMDATMLLDPEKGFFKGNPAAVEMFGCKDEAEFTTKTPTEMSPEYQPDGRPSMAKAQEMIAIAMEKGSHFFEWTQKRVDGREFFADILLAKMEWEGKTVLQATIRDITERKKTEEALRESEERMRILFEYAPDAYCLSTLDGSIVDANRPALDLTGYSKEESIGKSYIEMGVISLDQFGAANTTTVRRPDEPLALVLNRKDGTKVTVEVKTFPVEVKGQTLLLSIARDITERKKAQEAIAESERYYRLLAENASDVITVMGMDLRPTYMSPSVTRLLGYSVEEAMAHGMAEGLTPASSQAAAEALAKVLDEEQRGQKHEPMTMDLEFRRKDGSVVWVAASLSLIRNSDGQPVEILSNLHDISERKLIEGEKERAKEEAETANRAKSDFLASMSHEIRTPMNGVVGMTGLLADTPLNPEQRDYVESIRSSAEALMTIINDILDFSKVEAGKLNLEKMDFDLRSTMENMSDVLAVRAREKGLEYVWLLEPNVPTRLVGDPGRLRQIIINLVGNAVKFTPKGNVDLRISLVSESDTEAVVQFDVRDTGIGIPSDKIGSLFKPFTQVDTSTTRKYGGTGLGLSISKRLVELMGGQLGVESREGMGSTFWFTARLGKQSGERKSQELPLGMSGLRVLGVDDNPTNRKVLEHMLQAWGCRVEVVENAAMAMARLHAAVVSGDPFRVAIVDIMMPEVDGETLGRMVKATPQLKDTVLIASSSSGGRDDAARLGKVGFAHYLTKPIKQSQLFNAIASCVTREGEKTTAATAAAAPSCTAVAETGPEQQKARILLAEDNAVNQKVAIAMLRKMGYSHVDVVASGAEVLKALEKIPYDLVLMDVHMPEMDGLEATRRIRDAKSAVHNHLIPVVAMTASAMKGDREMCLDAGMNDYISKPINRSELVRVLEGWATPLAAEKTGPPEAEANQTAKVFDRSALLERVGGDNEICAEILKTFLVDVPERIQEMEDALVRGDNATLGRGGHTIKGSAGNVGAPMLQEAAGRLEAAVAAGELGSLREKLDAIVAEFERFKRSAGRS